MHPYVQDPPFSMQIEATEGCNLRCGFCGIRGIRAKGTTGELSGPYKFMTVETADRLAMQIVRARWNPRLEFAMHGEPTMNPALPDIVERFRSRLPDVSIMLTTNGIPLLDGGGWHSPTMARAIRRLFGAGVNTIAVDDYAPHRVAPALRADKTLPVMEYPADHRANPHTRHYGRRVVIVEDIAQASEGTHSTLNNHAGSAAPPTDRMVDKVCTLPFREMSVRWDGNVALCCNDWRGQYPLGNAAEDLLGTWHSHAATSARRLLMHEGRHAITPCAGCDYRGTRVGLLPQHDGSGRDELGVPTAADRELVAALAGEPTYTPVVLRKWEVTPGGTGPRSAASSSA